MQRIARALGAPHAAQGLYDLGKSLRLPQSLQAIGMKSEDLHRAAALALQRPYWNPPPLTAGNDPHERTSANASRSALCLPLRCSPSSRPCIGGWTVSWWSGHWQVQSWLHSGCPSPTWLVRAACSAVMQSPASRGSSSRTYFATRPWRGREGLGSPSFPFRPPPPLLFRPARIPLLPQLANAACWPRS